MRIIAAPRVLLEAIGLTAIIAAALFFAFPGALDGIGMTEAVRSAQNGVAEGSASAKEAVVAPADMVAVLLTVVTIMLGVVAFIVSVAALVGYNAIKESAVKEARAAALAKVEETTPSVAREVAEKTARTVASAVAEDATAKIADAVLQRITRTGEEAQASPHFGKSQ